MTRKLTLKSPDACFQSLYRRVPGYIRLTFASGVVLGLAVHLYMFANKLTNHDDTCHLLLADYGTASGRWLLTDVMRLDGPFSVPWLIGLLSVLCLAGTACFTVSLLRIRRPLGCIVTAAVLVSFPTVMATFTYMFSADAYFLSLLLAAFSAWSAARLGWWGSALGVVALTLSMGIYQSYFPVAAALMVGALLFETLDGERSFRELILKGIRLATVLAAAMVIYMIIVRFTSRDMELVDYMGISSMGKLSLRDLPQLILKSYGKYVTFYLYNDTQCHFGFLPIAFTLTALVTIALEVLVLLRRRLGPARTVLAVLLVVIYPLAGNLIYIMVPGGGIHALMIYGMALLLPAPVALAEYAEPVLREDGAAVFHGLASWIILLSISLTAFSYAVMDNTAYLQIDLSMRQCTAYSNRLLERVEACEGYVPGMPVVLVGSTIPDASLEPTPEFNAIQLTGVFDQKAFRTSYSYDRFLRYFLGFSGPVYLGTSQEALNFGATDQVQAMPLYPQTGSVQLIDGCVVVKLNES